MIKRERYYDGYGNELRMDEASTGMVKIAVNRSEIIIPESKLIEMVMYAGLTEGQVKGKHVKHYEIRKDV